MWNPIHIHSVLLVLAVAHAVAVRSPPLWVAALANQAVASEAYRARPAPANLSSARLASFVVGLVYLYLGLGAFAALGLAGSLAASYAWALLAVPRKLARGSWRSFLLTTDMFYCWAQHPAYISLTAGLLFCAHRVVLAGTPTAHALFWPFAVCGPVTYTVQHVWGIQYGHFRGRAAMSYLWYACAAGILASATNSLTTA